MESYAFTKKKSIRGNMEMRTTFGRNMAIVLSADEHEGYVGEFQLSLFY